VVAVASLAFGLGIGFGSGFGYEYVRAKRAQDSAWSRLTREQQSHFAAVYPIFAGARIQGWRTSYSGSAAERRSRLLEQIRYFENNSGIPSVQNFRDVQLGFSYFDLAKMEADPAKSKELMGKSEQLFKAAGWSEISKDRIGALAARRNDISGCGMKPKCDGEQ